jgi:hypothetical protein
MNDRLATKFPGFIPSKDQIRALTTYEMTNHRLTQIECYTYGVILNLTFIFANCIKSPPEGTYEEMSP